MPDSNSKPSLPLPMLPGESSAAFYPLCGIAIYPPPPIPVEIAAHEVEHSLASSTVVMHFLRALAESVHCGVSVFATLAYMNGSCPTPILVPGMRQPYVLGIRNALLRAVGQLTLLPEEVCGLIASMESLRRAVDEGERKVSDAALRDYEAELVEFYDRRIPRFGETYHAMRGIDDELNITSAFIKRYALNCSISDLLDTSLFEAPPAIGEMSKELSDLQARAIEDALDRVRSNKWNGPAQRFRQGIAVIQEVRKRGIEIGGKTAEAALCLLVKDFDESATRGGLDPRGPHIPDFRQFVRPDHAPRDLMELSVRFWKEAGGDLQSETPVYSQSLFREGEGARETGPLLSLARVKGRPTFRIHDVRSEEDRDLCMRLFMAEFWREQLTSGNGLTCPFDVLEGQEFAHSNIHERPGHLRSLWGIWHATRFDPDLAHTLGKKHRWEPPSCLELGAELRIAQRDTLWSD